MVDIETLSTRSNAVLLSIGAIKFDITTGKEYDTFYVKIDRDSCNKYGLHEDPNTIKWWESQSKEAREEAFKKEGSVDLKEGLLSFSKWVGDDPNIKIWCQGANFDVPILQEAYRVVNLPTPWRYYNVRDTRTAYDMGKVDYRNISNNLKHHPLEDCRSQIRGVSLSFNNIFSSPSLHPR